MASKSTQQEPERAEVFEEALDVLDTSLDRVKALYEQYFLGIQKQPPTYLHTDVERKLRDLSQLQVRNTALRYRFVTLQQKFGSYNAYWRRTVRQIENGTYVRNLSKIGREAAKTGAEIPEEILAAMPKRMRDQVRRDRDAAIALARHRNQLPDDEEVELTLLPEEAPPPQPAPKRESIRPQGAYRLDESDGNFDLDAFFASVGGDEPEPPVAAAPVRAASLGGPTRPSSPALAVAPPVGPPPSARLKPGIVVPPRPNPGHVKAATPAGGLKTATPSAGLPVRPPPGQQPAIPPIPARPVAGQPAPERPLAPSQVTRPNPIVPGSSTARPAVPVETMSGPFAREPARPVPAPAKPASPAPVMRPPPGMTDADVNALYAKYVKAKEMVGEAAGPGAYGKLLKTINAQAPKIMEQYKAKGVDFSVVVKDNQVIIRAKPKP